jgi:hypothetical protein
MHTEIVARGGASCVAVGYPGKLIRGKEVPNILLLYFDLRIMTFDI